MTLFLNRFLTTLLLNICLSDFSKGQDILFRSEEGSIEQQNNPLAVSFPDTEVEKKCKTPTGGNGFCKTINDCSVVKNSMIDMELMNHSFRNCGWKNASVPLVCCPKDSTVILVSTLSYDLSCPAYDFEACGVPFDPNNWNFSSLASIYSSNEAAEELEREGYTIVPLEMDKDLLLKFSMSNGTHTMEMTPTPPPIDARNGRGSKRARRSITNILAIIGEKKNNRTKWFCDGVIINRKWILSAAHCFIEKDPAIVRLGEYDLNDDTISPLEFPMDFEIEEVVYYPEHKYPSSYHDLVLIRLKKKIPYHRPDMVPVCLPWDQEVNFNLLGQQVTLLGWGATTYAGPMSTVVQEVNVTVFDPTICNKSYSTLSDYSEKFPIGIWNSTTLCAGDIEGGKDSCQGDSGGPIVYQDKNGLYTLAGIVSTGFGCGLKEFPGIYTPIHRPDYLSWIKKTAFV